MTIMLHFKTESNLQTNYFMKYNPSKHGHSLLIIRVIGKYDSLNNTT